MLLISVLNQVDLCTLYKNLHCHPFVDWNPRRNILDKLYRTKRPLFVTPITIPAFCSPIQTSDQPNIPNKPENTNSGSAPVANLQPRGNRIED